MTLGRVAGAALLALGVACWFARLDRQSRVAIGLVTDFIRPVLIRKEATLPLAMIFAGIIGGLIAFGIIGLFIGPVVLAVAHALLKAWVSGGAEEDAVVKEGYSEINSEMVS